MPINSRAPLIPGAPQPVEHRSIAERGVSILLGVHRYDQPSNSIVRGVGRHTHLTVKPQLLNAPGAWGVLLRTDARRRKIRVLVRFSPPRLPIEAASVCTGPAGGRRERLTGRQSGRRTRDLAVLVAAPVPDLVLQV